MLNWRAILLAIFALALTPLPAAAWTHGSFVPASGCTTYLGLGSGDFCNGVVVDGVTLAPPVNGAFQRGSADPNTFYTYATQTVGDGQTWTSSHPWNFNGAGVDYAVGYSLNTTLKDPSTATLPQGCTYFPTLSPGGGPEISCSGTTGATLTISGFNFSSPCVYVVIQNSVTASTVVVTNNKWINDTKCDTTSKSLISFNSGGNYKVVIANNLFDGGNEPGSTDCSGAPCSVPFFRLVSDAHGTGDRVVAYNAFLYSTGRPITANNLNASSNYAYANYGEGWAGPASDHGELIEEIAANGTTIPLEDYEQNVFLVPTTTAANVNTAMVYVSSGQVSGGLTFTDSHIFNNVSIINSTNSLATKATFTGTISGTTLTVSGVSGTISAGQAFTAPGALAGVYIVSGSGSTWTVSASETIGPTSMSTNSNTTSAAMAEIAYDIYGAFTARGNWIDPHGALQCFASVSGASGNGATSPVFVSNTNLQDASSISGFNLGAGVSCNGRHQ